MNTSQWAFKTQAFSVYGRCLDGIILQYIHEKYACLSVLAYIFAVLDASGYSDYQNVSWKLKISSIYSPLGILHICRDIAKQRWGFQVEKQNIM